MLFPASDGCFRGTPGPCASGGGGLEWPASDAAIGESLSNGLCLSPVPAKGTAATLDGISKTECTLECKVSESENSSLGDHPELAKGFRWTVEFAGENPGTNSAEPRSFSGEDSRRQPSGSNTAAPI